MIMERVIQLVSNLPGHSKMRLELTNNFLNELWYSLDHPPLLYIGEEFQYRRADGSYNARISILLTWSPSANSSLVEYPVPATRCGWNDLCSIRPSDHRPSWGSPGPWLDLRFSHGAHGVSQTPQQRLKRPVVLGDDHHPWYTTSQVTAAADYVLTGTRLVLDGLPGHHQVEDVVLPRSVPALW